MKTRRERNAIVFWNHESEAELGCDGVTAVHCLAKPLPCLIPGTPGFIHPALPYHRVTGHAGTKSSPGGFRERCRN